LRSGRFEFVLISNPQRLASPCCFSNIRITHRLNYTPCSV
jgi:hypothetical protein